LCSCSWEFSAEAGAEERKAARRQRPALQLKHSFCFETPRSAQHQTTRPHGHVPDITTLLYYPYAKMFIAPPHFHHYLCPPCFHQGLVEKINNAKKLPGPHKIQESLNSDNTYSTFLHRMSCQLPEILDDPLNKTTRVNLSRFIHRYMDSSHEKAE